MNEIRMTIWGREFKLKVIFDVREGETISEPQNKALSELTSNSTVIDSVLPLVKDYCLKMNGREINGNTVDNIFMYVVPQSLYIPKWPDGSRMIGLICAYKFNLEDGLVIVFKDGCFYEIGTQNIIL